MLSLGITRGAVLLGSFFRINQKCLGTASARSSKALLQQGAAEGAHGWVYGVALMDVLVLAWEGVCFFAL
jgi:hypothetical protein